MQVRKHADGNPTGVSVTWLGTSSGAPTLNRNNSGILLRGGSGDDETLMLVDAGMYSHQCIYCSTVCSAAVAVAPGAAALCAPRPPRLLRLLWPILLGLGVIFCLLGYLCCCSRFTSHQLNACSFVYAHAGCAGLPWVPHHHTLLSCAWLLSFLSAIPPPKGW